MSALSIVVVLYLLPLFLVLGVAIMVRRLSARNRTTPLGTDLLRPAGYSLQRSIDDLRSDLEESFIATPIMATFGPFLLLLQERLEHRVIGPVAWYLVVTISITAVVFYSYRAIRIAKRLSHLRLGLACEMAVAQELEQVVRPENQPYRIFHDLQFDGFNVDHLVVSPRGVFVIETKGRSKLILDGKKQAKVRLEGDALHFPTHVERQPLEQVRMNVKAVRSWLTEATGFDVPVGGILVLPGWYVELKQRMTDPYVCSGKALASLLPKLRAGTLDLGQVQAIAHQVTQRVRDVDRERVM